MKVLTLTIILPEGVRQYTVVDYLNEKVGRLEVNINEKQRFWILKKSFPDLCLLKIVFNALFLFINHIMR